MLDLEESESDIQRKLLAMVKGDLLEWGSADIDFRGLQDGTLNLILRHRFEKEIAQHQTPPDLRVSFREQIADLKRENNSLKGKLSHIVGKVAEFLFANALRSRKRIKLSDFFVGFADLDKQPKLNLVDVRTRVTIQRADGKSMELDIVAESSDGRVLLVEVRKRQVKSNRTDVEDFAEKLSAYQTLHLDQQILGTFLSVGGFTDEARQFCQTSGIGWAEEMVYF